MTSHSRARAALVALAALALATPGFAAQSPPGVNIRWDNCYDDAGAANRLFACDTNTGTERLVLSFVLDSPMTDVSGQEIVVDLVSASASLPAWWAFKNAGSCRQAALDMSLAPASAVNCVDWAQGLAVGGIGAYRLGLFGPNSARIVAVSAVPAATSLAPDIEYFVMNILISHAKTVGTGACAGCDVPMCILFQSLNITTPIAANNLKLNRGANWPDSQFSFWQNGHPTGVTVSCGMNGCETLFGCMLFDPTATRNSTWGQVKSLYR